MSDKVSSPFVRIDDRLIHGQVVTTWVQARGSRMIWIVSDRAASEPIEVMLLESSVPRHLALRVFTVEDCQQALQTTPMDGLMILVERLQDAVTLCRACPVIRELNLGGLRYRPGKVGISRSVYLDDEDREQLWVLSALEVRVTLQIVPSDPVVSVFDKLKRGTQSC